MVTRGPVMRRSMFALAVPLAALVALAPMAHSAAPKVTTVFTDPANDAGLNPNNNATAIPLMTAGGLDLVKGTVARKGNDLVYSVVLSTSMQNFTSFPEFARLIWQQTVYKGAEYRFTVKSFDIGKPDPVQRDGTDRIGKVYDKGLFRLEQCGDPDTTLPVSFSQCKAIAYLKGSFNAATKTITWTMPLSLIKAKTGTKIMMGTGTLNDTSCDICFIAHYAERSLSPHTVIDNAPTAFKYIVPKP